MRVLVWATAGAFAVIGLLHPLLSAGGSQSRPVYDPVVITSLRADITVDRDGLMQATETITAEFPLLRHGIFRYWDVGNLNDPHVRQEPSVLQISLDGKPVPYEMLTEQYGRFVVAKIGDPNVYLSPGTHVYRIRYTVPGVLDPGATGATKEFATSTGDSAAASVFFWNVVAPAWNNDIARAEIAITLPGRVPGAQCSVGAGVGRACEALRVSGERVELTALDLPPRTPVTVRAGVDVPTPPRFELPWSTRWDGVLGRSVPAVMWLLGLVGAAGLGSFLWLRSTVEPPPGFPLQYAPPKGLGPVQCEYIRTEKVPAEGLTATLFYLAERGVLTLSQGGPKKWTVRGTGDSQAWDGVDAVSAAVGSALDLDVPNATFAANGTVSAGRKLTSAKTAMATAVRDWALKDGLVEKRRKEWWLRLANMIALVLAFVGFASPGFGGMTLWGLPFALFFLVSVRAWRAGVGTRRTAAGRQLWSEVGGFHRLLATESAESRFDFAGRRDLYTAYIPFAVAGGAAAVWAAKYRAATGELPPQPGWYHTTSGAGWTSASAGSASFDSFESALSSSI
ncbi:MAG: DUF2207 domain-containing protein, partial [Mycobacteriaceae bacterium]|nr:DUF2207 domain-containing protein [Mycobacteriaceae bacterium]